MTYGFKPMLSGKANLAKQKLPVYTSPKLDGIRVVIVDNIPMSRKLKPIPNKHIREVLNDPIFNNMDGEIIVGDPGDPDCFRNTTSMVMSHDKVFDFTLHVFDMVCHIPEVPWEIRFRGLESMVNGLPDNAPIQLVEHTLCRSIEDITANEEEYLSLGYEGAMLRAPDGPYKMGRSSTLEGYLTKLKRFEDSEAEIIGFEELMHNGNEAKRNALGRTERSTHKAGKIGLGTLGALIVRDLYSDVEFSIGTGIGLNDELRKKIWNNQSGFLGDIINYRFFPSGSKDKPRFPTFHGFRSMDDLS